MNKLSWAIGLLAAYSNAVQIASEAAADTGENGNDVNINLDFAVEVKGDHPHGDHHDSSFGQTQALVAIEQAAAALAAAQAQLAEMSAAAPSEDTPETKHVHIILDDSFTIDGTTWEDLKDIAMVDGFKESKDFAQYSAGDRAIISAFISAQSDAGLDELEAFQPLISTVEVTIFYVDEPLILPEVPPTSHTILITPDDANVVYFKDQTWEVYKATAMQFGWTEDAVIKVLPNFERAVIEAHQQAQFETGSSDSALTGGVPVEITWLDDESPLTRYFDQSMDVTLNDWTIVDGIEWIELKATAMAAGYTESEAYTNIGEVDKFILDELIAAQEALEASDSPLSDTTVSILFTYE